MKTSLAVALAAALSFGTAAHAEVRISGFGQIVGGTLTEKGDHFPERGYDDGADFRDESLFAIQFDADLNDHVSATAQIMAEGDRDFEPELAWAYANVKLGNGFTSKIGRQRIPFYRYSDFLDVGYAYPWIRPPVSMYNQPWSNFDGVSLSHSAYFGNWYSQAQVVYGEFAGDVDLDGRIANARLDRLRGVTWDVEYNEWLSLRAAYVTGQVTVTGTSVDQLVAILRQFRQPALADRVDYTDDKGTFKSLGFKVDKSDWLVVGEVAELNVDDTTFDNTNRRDWYVTVGHRLGAFTPNLTYGRRDADPNSALLQGIPTASPLYAPLRQASRSYMFDESFASAGLRWDFAANVAAKFDYTRFRSEMPERADADLVSAGLVFTF